MISVFYFFIMLGSLMIYWAKNPLKASIFLVLCSLLIFFSFHVTGSMMFFPILLTLLFVGGVILAFMVLSSLFPNEKFKKSKYFTALFFIFTFMLINQMFFLGEKDLPFVVFYEGWNFSFLIILISWYFFSFLKVISSEKISLRSLF